MRPSTTGISGGDRPPAPSQNFRPKSEWKHEEAASFLFVYLPGFVAEQLTITPDYSNRTVKIEGQRRLPNGRLLPLNETFSIPEGCDLAEMDKQFGRGILMLKMPKNIVLQQPVQPETTKDTSKEGRPETTKSQQDEETDPSRETSTAGFDKESTEKARIVTPVTPAVDGSYEDKKDENIAAKGEPTKPEYPAATTTAKVEGMEKESETAAAKAEEKEKNRKLADVKGKKRKKGDMNVSAKKGMVKGPNDDRKLILNMGAAVLIIMGIGVSVLCALKLS